MKLATVFLLSIAIGSAACACNIPVFRYALERWRPDQCEVVVFHRTALTAEQNNLLEKLTDTTTAKNGHSSAKVVRSDLSQSTALHRELWSEVESETRAALPYVVVRATISHGKVVNGWHGPIEAIGHSGVLNSPARKKLGRRLLAGHSIVWLMIGSSDEKRNVAARKMLTDNFDSLAGKIELPEGIGLPGSELYSEVPLLLKFSMLEIERSDQKEEFLVKLLSGFQRAAVAEGEPLIIPVFGRGRALEVIPAGDLSVRLMEDLTVFLSGACSCQVKEQNPGFDLLLSVDWDMELFGEGGEPPPAKTTRDRERPTLLTIPPGK
jgi:hypothetical protein